MPRQINKDESKFHTKVMKWLEHNDSILSDSYIGEAKIVRRDTTNFLWSELSDKEERVLLRAKYKKVRQTHSDAGRTGTNGDMSCISGGGYIFLQWYRPRNKVFYIVDIDAFIKERDKSLKNNIKSLTVERAEKIALHIGEVR